MIYGGNIVVEKAQHVGQISPVLKWPMDKVYWVMPASGLILVWYSVMNIIDNYRNGILINEGSMDIEYIYPVLILFGSFAVMLAIGVPITFAIGLSSLLSIITALPPDAAISVISQKMTVGRMALRY